MPPPAQAPAAYVPTVAPVYNWGGIYFGVNGGYGFGQSKWTASTGSSTGDFNVSGFLVGPTIGVNFQTDAFVFGIEGDFDGSWLDGTTTCTPVSCETKDTWLSTVRGRVGYAADRVLFYATGGGAFGDIQANTSTATFQKANRMGWTAGAGIEVALADSWTARLEYLYVDLQSVTFPMPAAGGTVSLNSNLVRLGVDYKFR